MQVGKRSKQRGIKPASKKTSAKARIDALETQLRISSQKEECVVGDIKLEGQTSKEPAWGRNRANPVVACEALGSKCKEPS